MSYNRRIIFLAEYKEGIKTYLKDEDVELPFLEASMFVNSGAAKDYYSGMTVTPKMNVSLLVDSCILDNIVNE